MSVLRTAVTGTGQLILAVGLIWGAARLPGIKDSSLSPTLAHELWTAAVSAQRAGQFGETLRHLDPLLEAFPENPLYLSLLAESFMATGQFASSAAAWERFIPVAPFSIDACPGLGRAYEALEKNTEALDAHRRCLAMDSSKSDLMLYLALSVERNGTRGEAERLFRSVLARSPGYGDAQLGLARVLIRNGDLRQAEPLVIRALADSPENPDALLVAAMMAEKKNDPDTGIRHLTKAIRINPRYKDLYTVMARIYASKGDTAATARTLKAMP